MALHFPPQADIPLQNPPLTEVVCQVRFPPILSIGKEAPIEFQERVRGRFPEFNVQHEFLVVLPEGGVALNPGPEQRSKAFRFQSSDKESAISLAINFFALTTKRYQHWARFADDLRFAYEAVRQVYEPPYATRIGLRYINRLTPASTGAGSVAELLSLVRPELSALLRADGWSEPIEMLNQLSLTDGPARLTLRSGYERDDGEPSFLLDFDYFEEGSLELANLLARCDAYHDRIYAAFRWCVPEASLLRFQPIQERGALS